MQRQALLDQACLDARGGVVTRVFGVAAEQRGDVVHEGALDLPGLAEAFQAALDQRVQHHAVARALEAVEVATNAGQQTVAGRSRRRSGHRWFLFDRPVYECGRINRNVVGLSQRHNDTPDQGVSCGSETTAGSTIGGDGATVTRLRRWLLAT